MTTSKGISNSFDHIKDILKKEHYFLILSYAHQLPTPTYLGLTWLDLGMLLSKEGKRNTTLWPLIPTSKEAGVHRTSKKWNAPKKNGTHHGSLSENNSFVLLEWEGTDGWNHHAITMWKCQKSWNSATSPPKCKLRTINTLRRGQEPVPRILETAIPLARTT